MESIVLPRHEGVVIFMSAADEDLGRIAARFIRLVRHGLDVVNSEIERYERRGVQCADLSESRGIRRGVMDDLIQL